jgi:hypothetical protein
MQIAKRVYSLAQEQHDSALMIGACRALAVTLYFLGDFEAARQYVMYGLQIWRSGGVHSPVEEFIAPAVHCLIFEALSDWHFGETALKASRGSRTEYGTIEQPVPCCACHIFWH